MLPGWWVRYHNGLVQALGHREWNVPGSIRGSEQPSLGERDGFPLGLQIRGAG